MGVLYHLASGAKAQLPLMVLSERLKPCPFKAIVGSEAWPFKDRRQACEMEEILRLRLCFAVAKHNPRSG
jgi:hypothetical protein